MKLAKALSEEPGLGSGRWNETLETLCNDKNDPEGRLRERLDAWLMCDRVLHGNDIPSRLVRNRCGMVAQWAAGRASLLAKGDQPGLEIIEALQTAAGHASLLGELAESQGSSLSEPQLARLFEEALADGVEANPHIQAQGGPIRVRSLAEIDGPCDRLIWLGLGTADASACRWSTSQLRQFREAGIDIDDGSKALSALRAAEVRGFCSVSDAFLAVLLPQDLEKRWHPIWLAIRGLLCASDLEQPPIFEDLVATNNGNALEPFTFLCHDTDIEPPQKPRPLWDIPAELLQDRDFVSATELSDRLGCPLKWTLNYQARLRPSSIAQLPGDFQLKGTFCHSVLERVFGEGGDLPGVDEAVPRVMAVFDERLPLDATPLAQPDRYAERQRLRAELQNATRVLIGALKSGGYRIVGIEVELTGHAFDKALTGWIDCVAQRDDGEEVIIDFKYGGRSKYYSLLEDGKAVQLATYAYGRSTENRTFPAIAYLVLSDGLLYTPSASSLKGNSNRFVINGPAIQAVWQSFAEAIEAADHWLTSDAPVPTRPLQDAAEWPAGTTLVLDSNLKPDSWQEVCKYCDYKRICGIQETS